MRALTVGAARRAAECRWAHLKRMSGRIKVLHHIFCTCTRHSSQFICRHATLSSSACTCYTCPERLLKSSDSRVNKLNNSLLKNMQKSHARHLRPKFSSQLLTDYVPVSKSMTMTKTVTMGIVLAVVMVMVLICLKLPLNSGKIARRRSNGIKDSSTFRMVSHFRFRVSGWQRLRLHEILERTAPL